jgi:recombination associated protein RdgC
MKNLTIFRSQKNWKPAFEKLNENLSIPGKLGYSWKVLRDGLPYITVGENHLLTLEFQSKLIPTQVINAELKKHLEMIEGQQGYKAGKKQKRDIKEAIIMKLQEQAFVTSRFINVWINTKHDLLCIETTSQNVADDAIPLLVRDLGYSGKPIVTTRGTKEFMRKMIDEVVLNDFELGSSCVLSAPGEKTIHYKNESLDTVAVRNYLAEGRNPTKLELSFRGDEAIFTIDENLKISKISLPDIKNERSEGETEEDYFDSTFTILAGQCIEIINALIEQLGEQSLDQQQREIA